MRREEGKKLNKGGTPPFPSRLECQLSSTTSSSNALSAEETAHHSARYVPGDPCLAFAASVPRRSFEAPRASLPFLLVALRLPAIEFTEGNVHGNIFDDLVLKPSPQGANEFHTAFIFRLLPRFYHRCRICGRRDVAPPTCLSVGDIEDGDISVPVPHKTVGKIGIIISAAKPIPLLCQTNLTAPCGSWVGSKPHSAALRI